MSQGVDLISILEKELEGVGQARLEEVGTVVRVFDGIVEVFGLSQVMYGELVKFDGGNRGMVLKLEENLASIVLLDKNIHVKHSEVVRRAGDVFKIGVSDDMLGRVINVVGQPLDSLGEIKNLEEVPVMRQAPPITERDFVNEPLETGIIAIDSLIPLGKGQRELLVGDRSSGKSAIIIDSILHQKNQDVICIYVSIGNKQSATARMIDLLEQQGAMSYTIIVSADSHEAALNQFLAPYIGCAIAEYFMHKGKDVFIAYDDLSNHAIAYREMSLLLRRAPGREAYPGDIFYIHSRLLERSCKLSAKLGGGSMTAMPVVQTQGNDISAYIPTNLISITDGQIILDSNLFYQGMRPAINIGASVSRVGGSAQTKATKQVAGVLKLDLARYDDLASFAKFGTDLDDASKKVLERGKRAHEILKQGRQETYNFIDQAIFLFLLNNGKLDHLRMEDVKNFVVQFASFIAQTQSGLYQEVKETQSLSDSVKSNLEKAALEFNNFFLSQQV